MSGLENVTAYPLAWPTAWPRERVRRTSTLFRRASVDHETRELLHELRRLGVDRGDVVVSSNVKLRLDGLPRSDQRIPDDPGVAVYFRLEGAPKVLACDKWDRPEHNLRAIALHVASIRGQERWGVGSLRQAFAGYAALPERAGSGAAPWFEVLGVAPLATLDDARAAFRRLVRQHHPDQGGDRAKFEAVTQAWEVAQQLCPTQSP